LRRHLQNKRAAGLFSGKMQRRMRDFLGQDAHGWKGSTLAQLLPLDQSLGPLPPPWQGGQRLGSGESCALHASQVIGSYANSGNNVVMLRPSSSF